MILAKAPFRITFFGGGSDYPDWYLQNGGRVINATINKFCYVSIKSLPPYFEYKFRLRYFKTEEVNNISEVEHPSINACLYFMKEYKGLEIVHQGDLPARSGLGSSSTFTVALLHVLNTWQGADITKRNLALNAINIEQKIIGEKVGSQDQIAAAHGGLNLINFSKKDEFDITPIKVPNKKIVSLENHLLLCFTGLTRTASKIAEKQVNLTREKKINLNAMVEICDEGKKVFENSNNYIEELGRLLSEQWLIKKSLTNLITNAEIDEMYDIGMKNGALGGKLLGAGGGGFLLFLAKPESHSRIINALKKKFFVPIKFSYEGSKIIYNSYLEKS